MKIKKVSKKQENRRLSRQQYELARAMKYGDIAFIHTVDRMEFLTNRGLFVMPHEIFNLYEKAERLNRFSSGDQTNPKMTYIEHNAIGGSTDSFFEHPFMGDYRVDQDWQEEMKQKRKDAVKNHPIRIGFILWKNPEKEDSFTSSILNDGIYDSFGVTKRDKSLVGEKLRKDYNLIKNLNLIISKRTLPEFDSFDYARITLEPSLYDKNMVAIPKNGSIEFIKEGKISLQIKNPDLEARCNPSICLDIREIDRFEVENMSARGFSQFPKRDNRVSVYIEKSNNGVHVLKCTPSAYIEFGNSHGWQDNYSQQIVLGI